MRLDSKGRLATRKARASRQQLQSDWPLSPGAFKSGSSCAWLSNSCCASYKSITSAAGIFNLFLGQPVRLYVAYGIDRQLCTSISNWRDSKNSLGKGTMARVRKLAWREMRELLVSSRNHDHKRYQRLTCTPPCASQRATLRSSRWTFTVGFDFSDRSVHASLDRQTPGCCCR